MTNEAQGQVCVMRSRNRAVASAKLGTLHSNRSVRESGGAVFRTRRRPNTTLVLSQTRNSMRGIKIRAISCVVCEVFIF